MRMALRLIGGALCWVCFIGMALVGGGQGASLLSNPREWAQLWLLVIALLGLGLLGAILIRRANRS